MSEGPLSPDRISSHFETHKTARKLNLTGLKEHHFFCLQRDNDNTLLNYRLFWVSNYFLLADLYTTMGFGLHWR